MTLRKAKSTPTAPRRAWLVLCMLLVPALGWATAADDLVLMTQGDADFGKDGVPPFTGTGGGFEVSLNDGTSGSGACEFSNTGGNPSIANCPCSFDDPNPQDPAASGTRDGRLTGFFEFRPDASYRGTARFGYRSYLSDAGSCPAAGVNAAVVTVVINAPPVVDSTIPDVVQDEDGPDTVIDLTGFISDADVDDPSTIAEPGLRDKLAFTAVIDSTDNPALIDSISVSPTGVLTISYAADQTGVATIEVTGQDNRLDLGADFVNVDFVNSVTTTFDITIDPVNDDPVVDAPIPDQLVDEDAVNLVVDLDTVFSDVDGDDLTYSVTNSNPALLDANIDVNELTVDYLDDQNGVATLDIEADDGNGGTVVDTVEITVNAVNDAPVAVTPPVADRLVLEDAANFAIDFGGKFTDVDIATNGDVLTFSVSSNNAALFDSLSISGTQVLVDLAANANGTADITIEARDTFGEVAVQIPLLTVQPANDPPTVANPVANLTVDEDAVNLVVDLDTVFNDIDGDYLTYSVTNSNPALLDANIDVNELTVDYLDDQNGVATLDIEADDGNGGTVVDTVEITVNAVNDAPVAVTPPVADRLVLEDAANFAIDFGGKFTDVDIATNGDVLTFSVSSNNAALFDSLSISGTQVLVDLAANANGTADITIEARDTFGEVAVQIPLLTVQAANDPPTVANPVANLTVDEDAADSVIPIGAVFDDPDIATNSDSLTLDAQVLTGDVIESVQIVGSNLVIDWKADANGNGSVRLRARDQAGATAQDDFLVTVNPVNDAPVLDNPIADVTVNEDAPDTVIDLSAVFSDVDVDQGLDSLDYTVVGNTNPALFDAVVPDDVARTLTLDYAAETFGSSTLTVRATDTGGLFVEDSFVVTVDFVDDLPVAEDEIVSMNEDSGPISIAVLANDFTEDAPVSITRAGRTVTIDGTDYPESSESPPTTQTDALGDPVTLPNGSVQIDGNVVLYNPKQDYNGTDFFTYEITDSNGDTSEATVTVQVLSVNDAPTADPSTTYTLVENEFLDIQPPGLLINAEDADDGDTLTATLDSPPANGSIVFGGDGGFTYTPDAEFVGDDTFTWFVADGTTTNSGGSYVVTLQVEPAPPPPAPPTPGVVQFDFGLADVPLELAQGAEPNVLVIMDDSGSMDWSLLTNEGDGQMTLSTQGVTTAPDEPGSEKMSYVLPLSTNIFLGTENGGKAVPSQAAIDADPEMAGNQFGVWRARNSQFNRIYYNPAVQYLPWVGLNFINADFDDVDPLAAPLDPWTGTGVTINLTTPITYTTPNVPAVTGAGAQETCTVTFFFTFCFPPAGKTVTTSNYYIPRYYTTTATGEPAWNDPRTLVEIRSGSTYAGGPDRADCGLDDGDPLTCTYDQELQNFANWFSYYRSREYVAKSALGRVVADASAIAVGYAAINDTNDRTRIQSMNASFRAGDKAALLDQIYKIDSNGGTPLRTALDGAGKHFECKAGDIFLSLLDSSPGSAFCPVAASPAGQCQQHFTLLFTDGAWNGGSPSGVGNEDGGTSDSNFDGGIYADALSNTLGDVAMRYYERDLQPGLADLVPTTARDEVGASPTAFGADPTVMHQHMTTFTIGFGVDGALTDADIPNDISGTVAWGDPFSNARAKIDDLRHAALNGRGAYLSAADAVSLNDTFESAFDEFSTGEGAASAVSFNSQQITEQALLFRGFYNTRTNTGDLVAERLGPDGDILDTEWSAAALLDSRTPNDRVMITFDSRSGQRTGIPFRYADMTPDQTSELTSDQVDFLRGERSLERPDGALRARPVVEGLLGDIVHSTPVFVGAPVFVGRDSGAFPTDPSELYSVFKANQANRDGLVYVASNDGIMRAVEADTGREAWAYIPDTLINGDPYANALKDYTSSSYSHKFFNDLSPAVNDVYTLGASSATRDWRSVLVGGLRGGGKGYYAIEINNPSAFATETSAATQVMWEFTEQDDTTPTGFTTDLAGLPVKDLGYAYSRPTIVLTNAGWAAGFGNGYNSTAGIAKLFVLFLEAGLDGWGPGDFVKVDTGFGVPALGEPNFGLPNGLGTPRFIDIDGNGSADVAYAGDLLGNLFRFDLRDSDPANWTATRIFQAVYDIGDPGDPSDDEQQPITNQPIVIRNPQEQGFLVILGTGSYITDADGTSTEIQSLYGIFDRFEITASDPEGVFADSGLPLERSDLVAQVITNEAFVVDGEQRQVRTFSENTVDYSAPTFDRGWKIDLAPPRASVDSEGNMNADDTGQAPPLPQYPGERAIRNLQLRGGFLFVNTIIPRDANSCISNAGGFALAFNPATGGRGGLRAQSAFDLNNDGEFDSEDMIDGGTDSARAVSGLRFDGAVPTDSSFIGNRRYTQLSDRSIDVQETNTDQSDRTGRLSWQELD